MTYLDWLKNQVEYFDGPRHNQLLNKLHDLPFTPIIERDENRAYDGIHLRDEYFDEYGDDAYIIDTGCSFLEFLVALARRMNYIYARVDEDRTADCFWMLIDNLGIYYSDEIDASFFKKREKYVEFAVKNVNDRSYQENGRGGLFPLRHPRTNQRNVEIWYQMNQYLNELMSEEGG